MSHLCPNHVMTDIRQTKTWAGHGEDRVVMACPAHVQPLSLPWWGAHKMDKDISGTKGRRGCDSMSMPRLSHVLLPLIPWRDAHVTDKDMDSTRGRWWCSGMRMCPVYHMSRLHPYTVPFWPYRMSHVPRLFDSLLFCNCPSVPGCIDWGDKCPTMSTLYTCSVRTGCGLAKGVWRTVMSQCLSIQCPGEVCLWCVCPYACSVWTGCKSTKGDCWTAMWQCRCAQLSSGL